MGYRRLFIMRKDLKMSPGKLAAQVGHCAERIGHNCYALETGVSLTVRTMM